MSDSFKVYASKDYVENKIEESRVQPDWNQNDPTAADYVKNRTHWEENSFETYANFVVENGTYNAGTGEYTFPVNNVPVNLDVSPLEIRNTVIIDDETYADVPVSPNGPTSIGFGDMSDAYPFIIVVSSTDKCITGLVTTLPGETHDVKMGFPTTTVHTIDPKFLPAGSGGAFVVNFTWGEDGVAADKTFEEVESAIREGRLVFARKYENYGDGEEYATQYAMTEYAGDVGYVFFTETHNMGSSFRVNQVTMRADGTINSSTNTMNWPET